MSFKNFLQEQLVNEASPTTTKVHGTFIYDTHGGKGEIKHGLEFNVEVYRTNADKFDHINVYPTDKRYYSYVNIGRGMRVEIKAKDIDRFLKAGGATALILPFNDSNEKDGIAGTYSFKFDKAAMDQIADAVGDTSQTPRKAPAPRALKGITTGIEEVSDTRAIVTCDNETAELIKKQVHDSKSKIKIRVMERKEGAKVYIDTDNKAGLDSAIAQVKKILDK